MKWVIRVYQGIVVAGVGLYALAGFTGYRTSEEPREKIDPSVRSSPGGYRSYHFWHSGHAGGK